MTPPTKAHAAICPYTYISPAKRAAQYRAIEAAYQRAWKRYISKLLKGAA